MRFTDRVNGGNAAAVLGGFYTMSASPTTYALSSVPASFAALAVSVLASDGSVPYCAVATSTSLGNQEGFSPYTVCDTFGRCGPAVAAGDSFWEACLPIACNAGDTVSVTVYGDIAATSNVAFYGLSWCPVQLLGGRTQAKGVFMATSTVAAPASPLRYIVKSAMVNTVMAGGSGGALKHFIEGTVGGAAFNLASATSPTSAGGANQFVDFGPGLVLDPETAITFGSFLIGGSPSQDDTDSFVAYDVAI